MPIQWDDETLGVPQKQPVYDGIIWDDDIGIGDASKERGTLGAFAKTALRVPENLAAKTIAAVQGQKGASVVDRGVADRFVNWVEARNRKLAEEYEGTGDFIPGVISKRDVAELGPNLAFSGVSMAGTLGGMTAAAPIPVPGARIAGGLAGGATAAYRMDSYQVMNDWLEKVNQESIKSGLGPISKTEEEKFKKDMSALATEHGAWEAGPEGLANILELALLTAKNLPGVRWLPKGVAGKLAKGGLRFAGVTGVEELTETPTQMGQQIVESKAGMTDEAPREWTSGSDILKSAKEVLPQVLLLSGFMSAGGAAFRKATGTKEKDMPPSAEEETLSEAATLTNMIDEGMTTGEINGQPFTPEIATGIIREAYADKALTGEDLDNFKEKYPDLRPVLNEIISEKVKSEINKEMEDADARGVLLGEDKDITAKELLTGKREKALTPEGRQEIIEAKIPAPAEPKTEVAHAPVGVELPEFSGSTEALTFGKDATPDQIKALKQRREVSLGKFEKLIATRDLNKASIEVTKAQLDKEAIDALEILREHPEYLKKPAKEVAAEEAGKLPWEGKQDWEMTKSEIAEKYAFTGTVCYHEDAIRQAQKEGEEIPERVLAEYPGLKPAKEVAAEKVEKAEVEEILTVKEGMEDLYSWYVTARQRGGKLSQKEIEDTDVFKSGKRNINEIIAYLENKGVEVVAKPLPPKLAKPTKPEAVTEEIKGEVIPEVAPKIEKEKVEITPEKKEAWEITRDEYVKQYIEEQRAADFPEHMITDKYKESIMRGHFAVVSKAFAEDKTIPPEVLKDYPDLKVSEKIEVETNPEGKEISVDLTKKEEATVTPKQQKEYLLAEIDKAIEGAVKEAELDSVERAQELRKMRINPFQQIDTVYKFEVPNDGSFEIPVGQLFEFQSRVKSTFPSTITSKQFKPTRPAKKAVPTAKYNKIIVVPPKELKPADIDRMFEEVADTEARDVTGAVLLNPFQNWLLSQDITKAVKDKIKSVAGKDYIEEARVKIETQDIEYAKSMVEYRQETMAELQDYYDSYKAKTLTLKQIEKETGVKRSGHDLGNELQNAKYAHAEAVRHLEKLEKPTGISEGRTIEYIASQEKHAKIYVPITRKEADALFDKGAAILVARFNIYGPETTGEEGYYMRLPVPGKVVSYDEKEIKSLYEKYKERHGGTESGVSITSGKTKQRDGRLSAEIRDEKAFATKATKPQDTITRADLKSIFAKMKNISTGVDKDGNFFFRPLGKPVVTILEVNEIEGYIDTSKGQIPVGSYLKDQIELKTKGVGPTADEITFLHEYNHFLEENNIISGNDIKVISEATAEDLGINVKNVTSHQRGDYIGKTIVGWQGQKNLRIRRVLKKIADFVNAIYEFVSRTRTAKGVLRGIETGEILGKEIISEKAGELIPVYQMAGQKAIGAPTGQLVKAQEMLAEGKDKKEVWRETGWMKGVENRWKWEIDDSGAELLLSEASFLGMRGKTPDSVKGQPSTVQGFGEGMISDPNFLSNIIRSKTFLDKGYSGLDIKTQRSVKSAVVSSAKDSEIFDSVIKFIPVDVVTNLRRFQLTPKMLFQDPSMFKLALTKNLIKGIPSEVDVSGSLVRTFALARAIKDSGGIPFDSARVSEYFRITDKTIYDRHKKYITRSDDTSQVKNMPLSLLLSHPELYKAYPRIKNVLISINIKKGNPNTGSYNAAADSIEMAVSDINAIKSITLHEAQHAIQEIENFARGGSPREAYTGTERTNFIQDMYEEFRANPALRDLSAKEIADKAREYVDSGAGRMERYGRLAGEIEAREVAMRKPLTKEQRRIMPPYAGEGGIPEDQWIITKGAGTSFSVSPKREGLFKQKGSSLDNEGMELNYTVHIDRHYGIDKDGEWKLISDKIYYDDVGLNLQSDTLKGLKDEITKAKPIEETKQFATKPTKDYRAMFRKYQEAGIKKPSEKLDEIGILEKEIQDLRKEFKQDIKVTPIKELVQEATGKLRLSDIIKEARIITRKTYEAIAKRKKGIALLKLKERYRNSLIKAKARKEASARVNKIIKGLKKIDTEKMSPPQAKAINTILQDIDLTKLSSKKRLRLEKTKRYLDGNPDAEMPSYVLKDLERLSKKSIRDLTLDEFESLNIAVLHHAHLDKVKQTIRVGREMRRSQQTLDDSLMEMKPAKKVKGNIVSSQAGKLGKLKRTGRLIADTFGIRHDHFDLIIESLAGQNSTMDKVLYQGVKEGITEELKYKQNTFKKFQDDLGDFNKKHKIKDITKWLSETIKTEKFELTRGERTALYRHSLNPDNKRAIIEGGFGFKFSEKPNKVHRITKDEFNSVIDSLSDAEKDFAGKPLDNLFTDQVEKLDKIFLEKNGYALPREENYYPKDTMPLARAIDVEVEDAFELFKGKWLRVGVSKGMLEKRKRVALPIYLNSITHDINKSVAKSSAYIGLEIPLSNASKLLYNPTFRLNLSNKYGEQVWKEIEKGLRDIAGEYQTYTITEKLLIKAKNRLAVAMLGVNPFVMAKQVLSLPVYLPYVKSRYLSLGIIDSIWNPGQVLTRHKLYSPELLERIEGGYSRDVADVFKAGAEKRIYAGQKSIKEKFMGGIKLFDKMAVMAGTQGAVLQTLDEFKTGKLSREVGIALNMKDSDIAGLTPEQKMKLAYKFADYATQRTQPMFSPEHRSSLSRGSAVEKLATMFGSFTNQALNLTRRSYREAIRTGDKQAYAKFAKSLMVIFVINTMGVMAIDDLRDRLYGRDERPLWGRILSSWSAYMFFVRDLASSVVSKIERGTFLGYDVSLPISRIPELLSNSIANGVNTLTEKDIKKRKKAAINFIDDSLELSMMLYGIPYATPKKLAARVVLGAPDVDSKEVKDFKENLKEINVIDKNYNELLKKDRAKAFKYDAKTNRIRRLKASFSETSSQLGEQRKRKERIMSSKAYTSDQKRKLIDNTNTRMTRIAKSQNKVLSEHRR